MTGTQPASSADPRHGTGPCFPGLPRETDAGIRRAKALISAPLHDFEEEPFLEGVGVDLEEFARIVAIVEDAIFSHRFQQRGVELIATVDIVIIVFWNGQEG